MLMLLLLLLLLLLFPPVKAGMGLLAGGNEGITETVDTEMAAECIC